MLSIVLIVMVIMFVSIYIGVVNFYFFTIISMNEYVKLRLQRILCKIFKS